MNPQAKKKGGMMFGGKAKPFGKGKPFGKKAFFRNGGNTSDDGVDDNAPLSRNNPSADMPGVPKAEAPKTEAPKSKELSQADIDKMSYSEAFKHFRAQGAGTKFTYKGSKQAAYRKGEEPESFKKNAAPKAESKPAAAAPKAESKPAAAAPAAAPKAESKPAAAAPAAGKDADIKPSPAGGPRRGTGPARPDFTTSPAGGPRRGTGPARPDFTTSPAGGPRRRLGFTPPSAAGGPRRGTGLESKMRDQYTYTDDLGGKHDVEFPRGTSEEKRQEEYQSRVYAKGGSVGTYSKMEMEHVAQMKKHGVPKKFVKQEQKEAMGMKKGGMACGGKMKYATGGTIKPYKPSAGDLNEKSGGDQEFAEREYQRRKAKPAPAPKPKAYAKGGMVRGDGCATKGKTKCKMR